MNTDMKVSALCDKLCKLYTIRPSTWKYWQKSIKPIRDLHVSEVNDEVVLDYRIDQLELLSEGTLKTRIGYLKGIWRKGKKWKLIKGENPWENADDGLKTRRRDPEAHPWEFYRYFHDHPYFVFLWFTGARIGEIAGMHPDNIVMNAPIPYFNLVHQSNRARAWKTWRVLLKKSRLSLMKCKATNTGWRQLCLK